MKIDITALFVCVDNFCKLYQKALKAHALPQPSRGQSAQRNVTHHRILRKILIYVIKLRIEFSRNLRLFRLWISGKGFRWNP